MGTVIALLYSTEYGDRHGDGHSQDGVNDSDVLALKELAVWQRGSRRAAGLSSGSSAAALREPLGQCVGAANAPGSSAEAASAKAWRERAWRL